MIELAWPIAAIIISLLAFYGLKLWTERVGIGNAALKAVASQAADTEARVREMDARLESLERRMDLFDKDAEAWLKPHVERFTRRANELTIDVVAMGKKVEDLRSDMTRSGLAKALTGATP